MSAFLNVGAPHGPAFNQDRRVQNHADDAEYDRLRNSAQHEASLRGQCFDASKRAYAQGDGALAHQKSEEGKEHGRRMEQLNEQAALYVFRANNASCKPDELDLHGLHVDEAKLFTEQRIVACKQRREDHLHIIVGKGIHSVGHIQKLKPAIEELCRQHGFQYKTEHNEGRIYVTFPPESFNAGQGFPAPGGGGQQQQQQQYMPQQQQQQQYQQQQYQQQQGGGQGQGGANWQQYNTPQNRRLVMRFFRAIFRTCMR